MAKEKINSETLKAFRQRANLSQQKLADRSHVSKATIARIEGGSSSANSTTVNRLAKALGVNPESLDGRSAKGGRESKLKSLGYRPLKGAVRESTALSFRMVERRYGISLQHQIELAPLFAALLAEGSLAWRKEKAARADEATKILDDADYGHAMFDLGAFAAAERKSIDVGDVFGKLILPDVGGDDHVRPDPFSGYLQHLAERSGSQFIKVVPHGDPEAWTTEIPFDVRSEAWTTEINFEFDGCSGLGYSIDAEELDRLTGGDKWAEMALLRVHARIADIPENLLSDDATAERLAWLKDKIPQNEIEAAEAEDLRIKRLVGDIDLNLQAETSADHQVAEGQSDG